MSPPSPGQEPSCIPISQDVFHGAGGWVGLPGPSIARLQVVFNRLRAADALWFRVAVRVRGPESLQHQALEFVHQFGMPARDVVKLAGIALQVVEPPVAARRRVVRLVAVGSAPAPRAENV